MGRRAYITLDRLAEMPTEELKAEWARRYAAHAPSLSPDLLRLGIAYRLQEQKLGGVSRSTRSLLRELAAQPKDRGRNGLPPRKLTIGTRLVRDWHGARHTVTVLENGFEYDGKKWRSLTAIAKAISGSHCSGPGFFGLTDPKR
ncbi:DUF2924 domain-containing protein [Alteraurantiacibacter aestuarii]|uniref:DUF2924 domain-containing protein n=1 Tax=Alteraurantiacibacter aestuarii TaxID=650004 RepID=A0A844ZK00_9SPHN|nr:DUF2924 domain-containing protein [Alteraurantiacibacter aestuarii]MXO87227.1 DUF2924 domain-containing protein [Alteraurantiacibacter aestuarii]